MQQQDSNTAATSTTTTNNNIQYNNVGNLGDVIKHIALIKLIQLLLQQQSPSASSFLYIDFHTFLMQCPIATPERKQYILQQLQEQGNETYAQLQRARVEAHNEYLCSSGIAYELLMQQNTLQKLHFIFSEQNPETRKLLQQHIDTRSEKQQSQPQSSVHVMHHSTMLPSALTAVQSVGTYDCVMALVDPFKLEVEEWQSITSALLTNVHSQRTALLAFNYDKTGKTSEEMWTPFKIQNENLEGPQYTIHLQNHHLAIYCSANLKEQIVQVCNGLQHWQKFKN